MPEAVLITVSDIHLSHTAPICRADEPDWYGVMIRQLKELNDLAEEYDVPIACAGDIFHRYSPPLELVNFALRWLPQMYAVPGQHDLPYHVYKDMHRTAYGCLVEAGSIINLEYGKPIEFDAGFVLHGYPWGSEFNSKVKMNKDLLNIAIVHQFIWKSTKTGYIGAPKSSRVERWRKVIDAFDVCVFGDNHKGFKADGMVNNGTFICRNIDEEEYQPCVSIIYSDGTIKRKKLRSTFNDLFTEESKLKMTFYPKGMSEFVKSIRDVDLQSLNFDEAVRRYANTNNISKPVVSRILETSEE